MKSRSLRGFLRRMRDFGCDKLPHGFFNPGRGGTWHLDTLQEMDAFLTRLGIWRHARRRYGRDHVSRTCASASRMISHISEGTSR